MSQMSAGYNTAVASAYYDAYDSSGRNMYAAQDARILNFEPFNKTLETIQRIVPNKYIVIAGGAVRDLFIKDENLIKDIDLFILDVSDEAERASIANSFQGKITGGMRVHLQGYPQNFGLMWETVYPHFNYSSLSKSTSYFPKMFSTEKKKKPYTVQIIGHAAKTTDELLEDFDWKCCQFAYDGNTVWRNGAHDFYTGELTLGNVRNPFYSMARGFYLQEKFRHVQQKLVMSRESMLTLASMMLLDPEAK